MVTYDPQNHTIGYNDKKKVEAVGIEKMMRFKHSALAPFATSE